MTTGSWAGETRNAANLTQPVRVSAAVPWITTIKERSRPLTTPPSTKTANPPLPTKTNVQENAAYEAKREARRTAARALRILLTARACRRITSALKERELAAARKADRA